jgi:hypothetical protein
MATYEGHDLIDEVVPVGQSLKKTSRWVCPFRFMSSRGDAPILLSGRGRLAEVMAEDA